MQPVETTGDGVDGDFDGVTDEITVGDMTALTIYLSAQPRPTTKLELAALGVIDPLSSAEVARINQGRQLFQQVGCATCHVLSFTINDPVFTEPSRVAGFRDVRFPAGQDPVAAGVDAANPVKFDLTRDQPDNQIRDAAGNMIAHLGALKAGSRGSAIAELFGDLKRHNMGSGLAEGIDETGAGAATFVTRNLWGVGSTGPYLHDGRALTLADAILAHGGEAATARRDFQRLTVPSQQAVIAFLENLVLFKLEEEDDEVVVPPPATTQLTQSFRIRRR
jgi:cytochrome c peroxidase